MNEARMLCSVDEPDMPGGDIGLVIPWFWLDSIAEGEPEALLPADCARLCERGSAVTIDVRLDAEDEGLRPSTDVRRFLGGSSCAMPAERQLAGICGRCHESG